MGHHIQTNIHIWEEVSEGAQKVKGAQSLFKGGFRMGNTCIPVVDSF